MSKQYDCTFTRFVNGKGPSSWTGAQPPPACRGRVSASGSYDGEGLTAVMVAAAERNVTVVV
jgi:hypothetical protein